jgi:3-hydroxyisobutyrate dehydrogenase
VTPPVGFLGLGRMGGPMVAVLLAAGRRVRAYDVTPAAVERAAAAGAEPAASAADVLAGVDALITMLPDERAVEAVSGELLAAWPRGLLWIEMSSSAPATTRALAAALRARGGLLLDAPVTGGTWGAASGELTIMAGGDDESFERARPLLEILGRTVVRVGSEPGAGDAAKAVNQLVMAINTIAAVEGLALALREGVDPRALVTALQAGAGASEALGTKVGRFALEGRYDSGFTIDQLRKDLRIALEAAETAGLDPGLAARTRALWDSLAAAGHGPEDHTRAIPLLLARDDLTLDS